MPNFKPIKQNNDYACGAFVVINAINYVYFPSKMFGYKQLKFFEDYLKIDKEWGTEEEEIVKFLRGIFYVKCTKKFSKKAMDKWLDKSQHHQVIILYCVMAKEEEWHYCNIFERKNGKYHGANFRFITDKGPNFKSTINESKVYTFHKHPEDFYMMYLRPK